MRRGKTVGGRQTHTEDATAVQSIETETEVATVEQTGENTASGLSTAQVAMSPGIEHGAGTSIDIRTLIRIRDGYQNVTDGTRLLRTGCQAGVPSVGCSHSIRLAEFAVVSDHQPTGADASSVRYFFHVMQA